jgi:hypothetical protein
MTIDPRSALLPCSLNTAATTFSLAELESLLQGRSSPSDEPNLMAAMRLYCVY